MLISFLLDVSGHEELNRKHHQDAYQHLRLKILGPIDYLWSSSSSSIISSCRAFRSKEEESTKKTGKFTAQDDKKWHYNVHHFVKLKASLTVFARFSAFPLPQ